MKASEYANKYSLRVVELSQRTGVSVRTLNNWYKSKPRLFKIIVIGSAITKLLKIKD